MSGGCRAFHSLVLSHDCQRCFCSYGVFTPVCIPDCARELCDRCFQGCSNLVPVTFCSSSLLDGIGISCFDATVVEVARIPLQWQ